MTSLNADSRAGLRFLDAMFDENAIHHLVVVPPDGKPTAKSFLASEREALVGWINGRQGRDNVYFSVNRLEDGFVDQKAKKDNVAMARCLHVDVDDAGALERILAFQPKATAVVFSGGGYQAFWRLAEECSDLETVERHNAALARALGGDKCHNIDRIMRLPGTINMPNKKKRAAGREPTLAYVVDSATDWSRRYKLNDFDGIAETFDLQVPTVSASQVVPVGLASLPDTVSVATRKLIEIGDDPNQPIHAREPHFKSRSEASGAWSAISQEMGVLRFR
jgi:hypothetical protein